VTTPMLSIIEALPAGLQAMPGKLLVEVPERSHVSRGGILAVDRRDAVSAQNERMDGTVLLGAPDEPNGPQPGDRVWWLDNVLYREVAGQRVPCAHDDARRLPEPSSVERFRAAGKRYAAVPLVNVQIVESKE